MAGESGEMKPAADGVQPRPVEVRHGLVHDRDVRRIRAVGFIERAATQDRSSQRSEEIGGDVIVENGWTGLALWRSVALDLHWLHHGNGANGAATTDACRFH